MPQIFYALQPESEACIVTKDDVDRAQLLLSRDSLH